MSKDSSDRRERNGKGRAGAPGCPDVEELIVPYLDGEASADEARVVETHASGCSRCARSLDLHRQLRETLRAGPGIGALAGDGPATGLAGRARREALRRSRGQRRLWTALAAAALLAASGTFIWKPWARGGGEPQPGEELLGALDVLEVFHDEGLEPTDELVRLILDEPADDSEPRSDGALDPGVFKYLLEEEISEENL